MGAHSAHSYPFYIETQTGISQIRSSDQVYGTNTSAASSMGVGIQFGFFYSPFEIRHGLDIQLGLETDYLSGTVDDLNLGLLMPAALLRLQFQSFYTSVGAAPFIMTSAAESPSIDTFGYASNGAVYLAEVGYLYSATPKFSMGGAANLAWFSVTGKFIPSPSSHIAFVMRFYFGTPRGGSTGSNGAPLEWDGWRYIGK